MPKAASPDRVSRYNMRGKQRRVSSLNRKLKSRASETERVSRRDDDTMILDSYVVSFLSLESLFIPIAGLASLTHCVL